MITLTGEGPRSFSHGSRNLLVSIFLLILPYQSAADRSEHPFSFIHASSLLLQQVCASLCCSRLPYYSFLFPTLFHFPLFCGIQWLLSNNSSGSCSADHMMRAKAAGRSSLILSKAALRQTRLGGVSTGLPQFVGVKCRLMLTQFVLHTNRKGI